MDDDIRKIKMLDPKPFSLLCEVMFSHCHAEDANLWGIYPVNNLFFCKERVLKGRYYIIGCCCGFINQKDMGFWLSSNGKDDAYFSLFRYSRDGAVLRYEGACPDTDYYASGGINATRTKEREREDSLAIVAMFPTMASYVVKKNGHPEVKIIRETQSAFQFIRPASHQLLTAYVDIHEEDEADP